MACAEKVCRGGSSGSSISGSVRNSSSIGSGRTAIAMVMTQRQAAVVAAMVAGENVGRQRGWEIAVHGDGGARGIYTTIKWSDVG